MATAIYLLYSTENGRFATMPGITSAPEDEIEYRIDKAKVEFAASLGIKVSHVNCLPKRLTRKEAEALAKSILENLNQ